MHFNRNEVPEHPLKLENFSSYFYKRIELLIDVEDFEQYKEFFEAYKEELIIESVHIDVWEFFTSHRDFEFL